MVYGNLVFKALAWSHEMDFPRAACAILCQGDGFLKLIGMRRTLMLKPKDRLVQCTTFAHFRVVFVSHRTVPVIPVAGDKSFPVWIRFQLRCPPRTWACTSSHVSNFPPLVQLRCTCSLPTFLSCVSLPTHRIRGR